MNHNKKNRNVILGCLIGAALLSCLAPAKGLAAEAVPAPSGPLCIQGTVHRDGERLTMTGISGDTQLDVLILNTSGETRILDAANGFPKAEDSLEEGEQIRAYISPAMALSMPPQSHAELILCEIPEDGSTPFYETVESLELQADSSYLLTTARQTVYRVDGSTALLPYLTRNIVTAEDLTRGRTCLIWKNAPGDNTLPHGADAAAGKIVLFAGSADAAEPSGPATDPELTGMRPLR